VLRFSGKALGMAPPHRDTERTRLVRARIAVGAALAVVLAATLFPFDFHFSVRHVMERTHEIEWELYYTDRPGHVTVDRDLLQNVALFAPLGASLAWLPSAVAWRRDVGRALGVGLALSVLVELLQLLTDARVTQLADVWRNGLGAGLGAAFVVALRKRRER